MRPRLASSRRVAPGRKLPTMRSRPHVVVPPHLDPHLVQAGRDLELASRTIPRASRTRAPSLRFWPVRGSSRASSSSTKTRRVPLRERVVEVDPEAARRLAAGVRRAARGRRRGRRLSGRPGRARPGDAVGPGRRGRRAARPRGTRASRPRTAATADDRGRGRQREVRARARGALRGRWRCARRAMGAHAGRVHESAASGESDSSTTTRSSAAGVRGGCPARTSSASSAKASAVGYRCVRVLGERAGEHPLDVGGKPLDEARERRRAPRRRRGARCRESWAP